MRGAMPKMKVLAVIAGFMTALIFASHYLVAKIFIEGLDVIAFAAWRGLFGGGILVLIALMQGRAAELRRALLPSIPIAFLGFFLTQIFFMQGLVRTSPTDVALLSNTIPLATLAVGVVMGVEKVDRRTLAGLLLGFFAVAFYVLSVGQSQEESLPTGHILILTNVICFGVALQLMRKLLVTTSPIVVAAWMLFGGGLGLALISFQDMPPIMVRAVSSPFFFAIFLNEMFVSTTLGFLLNFFVVQQIGVNKANSFIYFQPVLAAGLTFLVYGTPPSWLIWPTLCLIIVASRLTLKTKQAA